MYNILVTLQVANRWWCQAYLLLVIFYFLLNSTQLVLMTPPPDFTPTGRNSSVPTFFMILTNEKQTINYGKTLSQSLQGGDVLCLHGNLGTGKTTLTKGIARGLKIKEEITSPTFTLMQLYKIKNSNTKIKNFIHIDTYRLKDEQELIDIGALDYLGETDTICVIEWPEKIKKLLQNKKVVNIFIEHSPKGRKIKLEK